MTDSLPGEEAASLSFVNSIDVGGYFDERLAPDVIGTLKSHSDIRFRELGESIEGNDGYGFGTEYSARLVRVREAAGVDAKDVFGDCREKFEWGPRESVDVENLVAQINEDEELQITDYRGRQYHMVKEGGGFLIIGAYDSRDRPMSIRTERLEGKRATLGKWESESDRWRQKHGITPSPYITLVTPGRETIQTRHGEMYEENARGSMLERVGTSRMRVDLADGDRPFGILVSKLKVIPKDPAEKEKASVARWRIEDSREVIKEIYERESVAGKPEIRVGELMYTRFWFGEEGGFSFTVQDLTSNSETEYTFNPNGGNSYKEDLIHGHVGHVPMEGLNPDGSRPVSILQAARSVDEFRYQLVKALK